MKYPGNSQRSNQQKNDNLLAREMELNEELRLSYYQKVSDIDAKHEVSLVKHTEDGRFFVMKKLKVFDYGVLCLLKEGAYPGIPAIHDLIRTDEGIVVIEEYISGSTLKTLMEDKLFRQDDVAETILWLCRILEPLHHNDPPLIHRDIKPSNVMVSDEGKLYLIDFDAGKFYSEGKERDTVLIGTEGYAAPEQYGFGQSDARTDIYSMGVLGNELMALTDQTASSHWAADINAAGRRGGTDDYSGRLKAVFQRCTAMRQEDRFQNVSELAAALTEAKDPHIGREADSRRDIKRKKEYTASYLPPGFRTRDIKYMALAVLWYGFIIYYLIHNITSHSPSDELTVLDHVFISLTMVMITFLAGNYRGIADRLPMTSSSQTMIRIAGYICYGVVITMVMIAVSTALDAIT